MTWQAVARDELVGGAFIRPFGKGLGRNDEPLYAVLVCERFVVLHY